MSAACALAGIGSCRAADPDAGWAALASASTSSPAAVAAGDLDESWTAPDGRTVTLRARTPHPVGDAVETVPASAASGDATPAFADAIAAARASGAAVLSIPEGTYTFDSLDASTLGHLVLSGLTDMTIEGNNATLVFENNADGIYVTESQRLLIRDLNVTYGFNTVSVGTMRETNGTISLAITRSTYPITAADGIGYLAEYDSANHVFVPGGIRLYQPISPTLVSADTYTSPSFTSAMVGRTFAVFHHYYGGTAVEIEDTPVDGAAQDQDITLDGVDVQSGPGMGIIGYGYARGLAIINSSVAPSPGALFSTEYDGIHLQLGGGDTVIANDTVAGTGDDAINAAAPVMTIAGLDPGGDTVTLGVYSRFVMPGDTLAFFDPGDDLLGTATVSSVPDRSYPNSTVVLASPVPGINTSDLVRDVAFANDRLAITGNTISDCECHAILLQTPDALVSGNTISETANGGIEALSDIGAFLEGTGAIDDLIEDNSLASTGTDPTIAMNWGAISLYGATTAGLDASDINASVTILDNRIQEATGEGCITVASSFDVAASGNTCTDTNLGEAPGSPGIDVANADTVALSGNTLSGASTGPVVVESSASNVTSH